MGVKKWLMKQYWRIVQVRGIWNLVYGVLLLAVAYYVYIPLFVDLGAFGPFVFAGILFVSFLILGYFYDRVFVMWAPQQEVVVERNPFMYVPHPRDRVFWFPIYSSLLSASAAIAEKMDLDTTKLDEVREYFAKLESYNAIRPGDIDEAIEHRKQFNETHPFSDFVDEEID